MIDTTEYVEWLRRIEAESGLKRIIDVEYGHDIADRMEQLQNQVDSLKYEISVWKEHYKKRNSVRNCKAPPPHDPS